MKGIFVTSGVAMLALIAAQLLEYILNAASCKAPQVRLTGFSEHAPPTNAQPPPEVTTCYEQAA